jgi:hypothetical protein
VLNVLGHFLNASDSRARGALPEVSRVRLTALTARTSGTGDAVNHHFVNHLKQTKLQKDARYQVNRSHNRRCSDHG